jgi:hypothetical protein
MDNNVQDEVRLICLLVFSVIRFLQFLRLLRALYESLDRESEMQRQVSIIDTLNSYTSDVLILVTKKQRSIDFCRVKTSGRH